MVLGLSNGASLVMTAFAGTARCSSAWPALATVIKRDLSGMGKFLFIGALILLVAGIANIFIQSSALMITLSVLAIGIFSAFILFDLKRVQDGEETNYITATLGVYLSIYNVFQSLLAICWASRRRTRMSPAGICLPEGARRAPSGPFFMSGAVRSAALEHRHAFHVRRVRKHVHHPAAVQR
jgi:hypothetical protein